jgi:hypothetical protein
MADLASSAAGVPSDPVRKNAKVAVKPSFALAANAAEIDKASLPLENRKFSFFRERSSP